jgi:hypothetical protein
MGAHVLSMGAVVPARVARMPSIPCIKYILFPQNNRNNILVPDKEKFQREGTKI